MNRIIRLAKGALRPLAVAVAIGLGAFSLAAPANAGGGWHGGGWHGGGGYYWHGGGGYWHGGGWGCCWGGPRYSFSFGFPLYYPYAYPYPAYPYYPPAYSYTYVAPSYAPPVTVAQAPAGPPPQQNWYYCDNPRGYYPYVQSCSAGWRAVPAQPPGTQTPN